jgi:hypothetical protein
VVALAPANDRVTFVAADMFKYVPPADAVLLKVKIIYCTSIPSIGSAMHHAWFKYYEYSIILLFLLVHILMGCFVLVDFA